MVPSALAGRPLRVVACLAFLALLAHGAHGAGLLAWHGADRFFDPYVYLGLLVLGTAVCGIRAATVRRERGAWTAMALGLAAWTAGDALVEIAWAGDPPFPSIADALYLTYYLAASVALVLLVRSRFERVELNVWLDGVVIGLTLAATAAALVFEPILEAASGNGATVAITLAYPVGDLVLLVFVAAIFTMTGFRPGRPLAMIGAGLLLTAAADSAYAYLASSSAYGTGGILDSVWAAGLLLIGFAASARAPRAPRRRAETLPIFVASTAFTVLAIALLILDHYQPLTPPALWLASAAVVTVVLRVALSFLGKVRALRTAESQALTDGLTGLRNRRRLMADLERALEAGAAAPPRTLVFHDLDGFKQYNDQFGHSAGDALLARLGARLATAVEGRGHAYRLGGDEFCVLFDHDLGDDPRPLAGSAAALSESGDGFQVTSSMGVVTMPLDASTPEQTLHVVADAGGNSHPGRGSRPADHQAHDVLVQTLREQEPELRDHMAAVAERAVPLARRLGLGPQAVDEVARAAELHDVGKMAIPTEILRKPGPLDEEEWQFMRQHTIIGERILAAAPALTAVARLVRASHERHDGRGYPDGLAGDDIPVGARIVTLCDAYDAMLTDRSYRVAMTRAEALAEIRRGAGSHFDPVVVDAFLELFAGQARRRRFKPGSATVP
jgi:two-component system, cell cycle response regulator